MKRRLGVLISAAVMAALLLGSTAAVAATAPTNQYHQDHRATPKLVFAPGFVARGEADPEAIARAYLDAERDTYRLPSSPAELQLAGIRQSLLATHVAFQQLLDGIPVLGAQITVSVDAEGRILKVYNTTYPVIRRPETPKGTITADRALDIAWADLRVHGELLAGPPAADLVWRPQGTGFRLVYRTRIDVAAPFGCWSHEIDAVSGEVLDVERVDVPHKKDADGKLVFSSYGGPIADRRVAEHDLADREAALAADLSVSRAVATGSGLVFDPDPKTTLQNASLLDTAPASTFDPTYFTKTLQDITLTSGTYRLTGPWVSIINFEAPATAPSTTTDGTWTAVRGNNAFNDTNTYFHIDQNQRYIQSLGFVAGTAIQDGPIEVDTDGLSGADNSHYIPSSNRLAFGHGGVDDNEDVDVILHEYMHALTHDINSSWSGADTGAMGEGFGDYWGGSYSYATPNGPAFHPEWAFSWDGHGSDTWAGRVMNLNPATNQYDPSCTYAAHSSCGGVSGDELWGTPVFQAFLAIVSQGGTREQADTIVLESQFGLGSSLKMPNMAAAMVATAQTLYPAGPHASILQTKFADHNILDLPAVAAPTFTHPTAGSVLAPGAVATVTWSTGGAPATTTYALEYTDQCTPAVAFEDDMESGAGTWTTSHGAGAVDWSLATTSPHSGVTSWFASQPAVVSDQYLALAAPVAVPPGAELTFWHSYNMETRFDGGVVEISTNGGGAWTDLGSSITQNGYNNTISSSYSNPIGGRQAFTGSTTGYIQTRVDLSAYAGSDILVRFRTATDSSTGRTGWWVDDVRIEAAGTWTAVGTSPAGASSMAWSVPAVAGTDYCARLTASAPNYSSSQAQSDIFTVAADVIFEDDFEAGDMAAWTQSAP